MGEGTGARLFGAAMGLVALGAAALGQSGALGPVKKFDQQDKFRQLSEVLPTANAYRTASGAPGHAYWQQRADYDIDVSLDEWAQRVTGTARITYHNLSPDTLEYVWLQLDRNRVVPDSDDRMTQVVGGLEAMSFDELEAMLVMNEFDGGYDIRAVTDTAGAALPHRVVKTMMRVDPPAPIEPGGRFEFVVSWSFVMPNAKYIDLRSGAEFFERDGNWLFEVAQWFPRMAAYTDYTGWQHKQFLGNGEFTLEFGDYRVRITAPADHVVAATGVLANPGAVLTAEQRDRLGRAVGAAEPVFIVTPEEARQNESSRARGTKTWEFLAENVRDFAWVSSRKFIWDAMTTKSGGRDVLCMSLYPIEGEPLWSRYSTQAVAHTIETYNRFSFDYPYPVAISVNGPVGGMEYPMICFNGPRPEADGTYTARTKYGLISVIIHEVGHNYFPMIVNSDERQWTWMDEGLNTFLQSLSEQLWEDGYPSRRGEPRDIVGFMTSPNQVPIMTNSESLLQFGANAYAKPATALNILRETVMGREVFDDAFRVYSRRWMFKRPEPADFFRTMEDASAIDLDWFWRGWFYTTDHVDLSVDNVSVYTIDTQDPSIEKGRLREIAGESPVTRRAEGFAAEPKRTDRYPGLLDFYNSYDPLDVTPRDRRAYDALVGRLGPGEREMLGLGLNFYVLEFSNVGGLVMPIIYEARYTDGTSEEVRIPAEIWRRDNRAVARLHVTEKTIESIVLDPRSETADGDVSNNHWPRRAPESRFRLFQQRVLEGPNPMREAQEEEASGGDRGRPSGRGG